jgi:hypothetical protein
MAAVLVKKTFQNVYSDITAAQRSVDWFLLGYEEDSKDRIVFLRKGEGELNEMNQALSEDMIGFGYMKVYDRSQEAQGVAQDFVHITFIGRRVKAQERARAVLHRLAVHDAFPIFVMEFEAHGKDEMSMERLRKELAEMKARLSQ